MPFFFRRTDRFEQVLRETFFIFHHSFSLFKSIGPVRKHHFFAECILCGEVLTRDDVLSRSAPNFPGRSVLPSGRTLARRRVIPSSICHLVGLRPCPIRTVAGGSSLAHHKYMHDFDAEAMKCCCSGSKALFVLPLPQALSLPPHDGVAVLPIVREVAYAREGRKKKGSTVFIRI